MESVSIRIDSDAFDRAVHGEPDGKPVLPSGSQLSIFAKPRATEGGNAMVVITFVVQLPDGTYANAQYSTTAALLESAGAVVKGWREGGHI